MTAAWLSSRFLKSAYAVAGFLTQLRTGLFRCRRNRVRTGLSRVQVAELLPNRSPANGASCLGLSPSWLKDRQARHGSGYVDKLSRKPGWSAVEAAELQPDAILGSAENREVFAALHKADEGSFFARLLSHG